MISKNFTLYFVLLSMLSFACKKDKDGPEPSDSGKVLYDNKFEAKLDTGRIGLSKSIEGQHASLILELHSEKNKELETNLLMVYRLPLETTEIPQGQFTFRGGDFFHVVINYAKSGASDLVSSHELQMTFSLRKIDDHRYSVEFEGLAKGKPISGSYSGSLGVY